MCQTNESNAAVTENGGGGARPEPRQRAATVRADRGRIHPDSISGIRRIPALVVRWASAVAGLCSALVAMTADAALVEIRFEGVVTGEIGSPILPSRLDQRIAPGTSVLGRVRYDTATPDSNPAASHGWYVHRDPRHLLELQIGGLRVATNRRNPELIVQILDGHPVPAHGGPIDRFAIYSRSNTRIGSTRARPSTIDLVIGYGEFLDSDALPSVPGFELSPDPTRFPRIHGQISTFTGV